MPLTLAPIGTPSVIRKITGKDDVRSGRNDGTQGNAVKLPQHFVWIGAACAAKPMEYRRDIAMKTLKDVKPGQTVTIVKLHGEGAVKRRIMDMGLTKGTEVYVRKVAPLGDPIEVNVRSYELSLRKADCEQIEVTA